MKVACRIMLILFMLPLMGVAQEDEKPKSELVALHYMKPKKGQALMLKKAVEAHNKKYHAEKPYQAGLSTILTGNEAGWMVWEMGPFSYTELDEAPGQGEHMEHWRQSVDAYVEEYGRVEYWRYNKKLSHASGEDNTMQTVWFVDIRRGEYYRFKELMTKIQQVVEKHNEGQSVWSNEYVQQDGRDVAIVFPFGSWADRDNNDFNMKEAYEAMHGQGSWQSAMDEWEDIVESIVAEAWRDLL